MSPKQKAKELFDIFNDKKFYVSAIECNTTMTSIYNEEHGDIKNELFYRMTKAVAKYCALKTVDEIIKSNPTNTSLIPIGIDAEYNLQKWGKEYWEEVKKEIQSL